jgi:hypothetical protein
MLRNLNKIGYACICDLNFRGVIATHVRLLARLPTIQK